MNEDNSLVAIVQQLETLIAYAQRPAVQIQLLALVGLLAVMAISGLIVSRWLDRHPNSRLQRARYLLIPVLGLLLVQGMIAVLGELYGTVGLIAAARDLLGLVLVYFALLLAAIIVMGERRVRPYHRLVTFPLFVLITGALVLDRLVDLGQLGGLTLLSIAGARITVQQVVAFGLALYLFVILDHLVQRALGVIVIPRFTMDAGAANAIRTITRYVVIGVGVIVSLGTLGFDLSTLALIGGGLSIGIGIGLQQIVSNFLSGVLLLFEQSLRPGDVVNVDGEMGVVQALSIRATTVRTYENVDLVIPNERFLTSAVKNYTTNETLIRGDIRVGVSYDADPPAVRQLLVETVKQHGKVLKKPEPLVFFTDFGASSLDFWVLFWVEHVNVRFATETDLRMMIWRAFEKHGITIPFPQRDVHLYHTPMPEAPPSSATPEARPMPESSAQPSANAPLDDAD